MDNVQKIALNPWSRAIMDQSATNINNSLNASLNLNQPSSQETSQYSLLTCNVILANGNKTPSASPSRNKSTHTPGRGGTTPSGSFIANNSKAKTPKTPGNGPDRFIPNRKAMNYDLSHYLITKAADKNYKENEGECSPNTIRNQKAVNDALNGDLNDYRIICCQDKAPLDLEGHANSHKVLYSSSKFASSSKKATRHIPSQPDRILDAPDIVNDYYLQLIDWSQSNILAVALNREIYLWNASSGEITNLLELAEGDYVSSLSWIQNGNHLAVGTNSTEVHLWDIDKCTRLRKMKGHTSRVSSLAWNSYILSSGSRSGSIFHHDVRSHDHHVGTLSGHQQEVCGLKWSPGGQYLASGGNDNMLHIWSNKICKNDSKTVYTFTEHQAAVKALAWCPFRPNLLASGGGTADRKIHIWNCNNGSSLYTVDAKSQVSAVLWNEEYKELISAHGYSNNELIIWKYPGLTKVTSLTGHTARVLGISMSPDGSTVVSVGADETLRFWGCFQIDANKKKKNEVATDTNKLYNNSMRLSIR